MIDYIRGKVTAKDPTSATIEANGIGYLLAISLNTFEKLSVQQDAKLLVHEVLREDTHDLYGFAEESERRLFRLLITVKGIGPASARLMLSSFPPQELARMIASGDEAGLKTVKGVGTRTAQQIIVELKSKLETALADQDIHTEALQGGTSAAIISTHADEAVRAFVTLGYTTTAAKKVIAKLLKAEPTLEVDELIRKGLRII